MNELFVKVEWPEIQDFQTEELEERYDTEVSYSAEENVWFVPLELYNEVYDKRSLIVDKDNDVYLNDLHKIAEQISQGYTGGSTNNTTWTLV